MNPFRSTNIYNSWSAMMARCYRPSNHGYSYYGAKGVRVDRRWHNFDNFKADMGNRPLGTTLHRIDTTRSYGPGNCCWATAKQQAAAQTTHALRAEIRRLKRRIRYLENMFRSNMHAIRCSDTPETSAQKEIPRKRRTRYGTEVAYMLEMASKYVHLNK